jgi:hypothetical protein
MSFLDLDFLSLIDAQPQVVKETADDIREADYNHAKQLLDLMKPRRKVCRATKQLREDRHDQRRFAKLRRPMLIAKRGKLSRPLPAKGLSFPVPAFDGVSRLMDLTIDHELAAAGEWMKQYQ